MTADEFVALAVKMRSAQKLYFRTRRAGLDGRDELDQARRLERELDRAAAGWLERANTPTLFPEPTDDDDDLPGDADLGRLVQDPPARRP